MSARSVRGLLNGADVDDAVDEFRADAMVSGSDADAWTDGLLRTVVDLLPTDFGLLLDFTWRDGECAVAARGVKRGLASVEGDVVQGMVGVDVRPGTDATLRERLLHAALDSAFVPFTDLSPLAGVALVQRRRLAAIPIHSQGVNRFVLLLSLPESTTRRQLRGLPRALQPLLATFAAGHRERELLRQWTDGDADEPLHEGIVRFDAQRRISNVNGAGAQIFRARAADVRGVDVGRWLPRRLLDQFLDRAVLGRGLPGDPVVACGNAVEAWRHDGEPFLADVVLSAFAGEEPRFVAAVVDRSEVLAETRRADTGLDQFQIFADAAPVGIIQVDAGFECLYVNRRWREIFGMTENEALGRGWISSIPHDDAETVLHELRQAMLDRTDYTTELRARSGGRHPVRVAFEARPILPDDEFAGFTGTFVDVTAQRDAADRLRTLASTDELTGLANRSALQERIEQGRGDRKDDVAGVLYLDLDGFKTINDSFGHAIGDQVLAEVAGRLDRSVREGDLVARIGGDEFVVLLTGVGDATVAERIAEHIRVELTRPMHLDGRVVHVSPSIGVALATSSGRTRKDLLKHADAAMYQAKEAGKNTVAFYSVALDQRITRRARMVQAARRGMNGDEFHVHYQLVGDLHGGGVRGVEALLRWDTPGYSDLSPTEFGPLLEDHGLIWEVGDRVLREACAQFSTWRADGLMPSTARVGVNVSPHQIRRPGWLEDVKRTLASTGLPPDALTVELTESALLDGLGHKHTVLDALHELGVWIALDDFGTGYSSLVNLRNLPIDVLKVDQVFASQMHHSKPDASIVSAVCALGRSLSMRVVAEGVNHPDTLPLLRDLGCDDYQGFLLHRPESGDAVTARLHDNAGTSSQSDDSGKDRSPAND